MSKTILCPIDPTDEINWRKVIGAAVEQAAPHSAKVIVMAVVPDIFAGLDWRYAIRGETGGSEDFDMRKVVADTLDRLNEIVVEAIPEGLEVETLARHGTVYEEILNVAEEVGADQIIMAAHRQQVSDFLLGTNTAKVARHAKCSVNVIR